MLEKDYKNLNEIIELCKDELEAGNNDTAAVLDYEDLKSLKRILECVKNTFDIKEEN